ncbi:MAG: Rieske 2Fe-2S domain-containing protein [Candidatus Latescibacterota bacterium]|nr:MAG: Rieske 2Fe-2S domain-containing protein [Candidatus Latescibacterota bacterium]
MDTKNSLITFGQKLEPIDVIATEPDWVQARPTWIERALNRALELPSGGWYVVGASRDIRNRPRRYRIDGREYVAWLSRGQPKVAPDACPHMAASLADGSVRNGHIVCPWHGLALEGERHGAWFPLPTFDDGVLVWVRLGSEDTATAQPVLPNRPVRYLDTVIRKDARCDPEDVIANRLDPWHGVHFHPHSFARLNVIEQTEDSITVRVVYRVFRRLGIEVDARFHCPEPRTIVMTIVAGEGTGSVVETHATPIDPGRTAIIEATLATSERPQFHVLIGTFGGLLRRLVGWRAQKLWAEDATYAERRYALRKGKA